MDLEEVWGGLGRKGCGVMGRGGVRGEVNGVKGNGGGGVSNEVECCVSLVFCKHRDGY